VISVWSYLSTFAGIRGVVQKEAHIILKISNTDVQTASKWIPQPSMYNYRMEYIVIAFRGTQYILVAGIERP